MVVIEQSACFLNCRLAFMLCLRGTRGALGRIVDIFTYDINTLRLPVIRRKLEPCLARIFVGVQHNSYLTVAVVVALSAHLYLIL